MEQLDGHAAAVLAEGGEQQGRSPPAIVLVLLAVLYVSNSVCGERGSHGAARWPCCRHAWLKEDNSKGERENAEEGRDSGVHFKPSAHAHARGEWGSA